MNARQLIIAITIAIALAITSIGCYTIIRHPSMDAQQYEESSAAEETGYTHSSDDRDCVRCHQDFAQYPYGHYYEYYPEYYWDYPKWGDYYAYPWWWDGYWYSGRGTGVAVDTVDKIARPDRQRGIVPPYSNGTGTNNLTPPTFNAGSSTPPVVGGSSGGTTTGGSTGTPPPTTNEDKAKKEDTKPPKRRGK